MYKDNRPKYNSETGFETTNLYDSYGRTLNTANYFGTTQYSYTNSGNGQYKIATQAPDGNISSSTTDASDRAVSSTDNGGITAITYDSRGNPTQVQLNGTTVNTMIYDDYGRSTSLADVDAGTAT